MKRELELLLKETSVHNPLKDYESKLDNVHLHTFVLRIKRHRFPSLFLMVDTSDRRLLNLSVEDPFDREPCIYKVEADVPESMVAFYTKLFERVDSVSAGIFRMPLKVKVLRSAGNESWLQKIFLQEKVKNMEFFLFQNRVSDENLEKMMKLLKSRLKIVLRNEGIDVFLETPEWVDKEHISLLHEMGVVLRKKKGIQPAQNPMEQAFLTLRVGYDQFFEEDFDMEYFAKDFMEKLKRMYEVLVSML
ncbi:MULTISPECIES: DUF4895 domain-containing protein [Thermotoga]|jgi:hypothetical protein|uniref:DUF4895 domain-containing protein n=2 Tax=Thermotoga petrophila TaxID=93929 RepID=D2C572_THEP2|nr:MULTISPECIES: DUF4895 domain-containing protein [Thermotoga]KUK23770.1 MAG: Uncharacterized protein XD57_0116 [Thermotoga petrophila]KUK34024.1 MAG: Uncharacterized protein XD64_0156 [Thermotoga sp. 47_83]MBZ4661859.1 hypothetical protein [Thermotoga sp.]ACB10180.1 conserved hypothetical protein [Thermotoga sp. RQ2]ADA67876.1 conserved hypothetical protein [Thermotoga petrophila RKU-10]